MKTERAGVTMERCTRRVGGDAKDVQRYRVPPGSAVLLAERATEEDGPWASDAEREQHTCAARDHLYERHVLLNADQRYAVLVILQGMDAAGKTR